jgi:hypothetical protein
MDPAVRSFLSCTNIIIFFIVLLFIFFLPMGRPGHVRVLTQSLCRPPIAFCNTYHTAVQELHYQNPENRMHTHACRSESYTVRSLQSRAQIRSDSNSAE